MTYGWMEPHAGWRRTDGFLDGTHSGGGRRGHLETGLAAYAFGFRTQTDFGRVSNALVSAARTRSLIDRPSEEAGLARIEGCHYSEK